MALTIGTNVASLQASAAASSVNRDLETSMARLSTGKRINSAADDAAGVAIASRLSSEIRGTDQAIRNALDGQALIDTAEGGHKEIEAILQRMREVSIQAASDTNNAQDRGNLQAEVKALITEIDRIAGVTTWAGNSVMDGGGSTSKTFSLQVGAATGTKNQINVAINDMGKAALGLAPSGEKWADDVNALGTSVGVAVDAATGIITLDATKDASSYSATIEGVLITGAANSAADTTKAHRDATALDFVTKINADATLTGKGIKAVVIADAAVIGSGITGGAGTAAKIEFKGSATTVGISWEIKGTDADGKAISETVAGIAETTANSSTKSFLTVESITATGEYATAGTTVKVGSTGGTDEDLRADAVMVAGAIEMNGISVNARVELIHGADDMSSSSKAMHAVTVIDAAIKTVNTQRSELGAISNRLSHTVSNMTNISTNLSAARGGIEDADFAVETTNLAKNQILQQASTAMLAQANASKQNVLSLLQ
jgi:flagellin